ncbi:MAG: hypothetical protein KatS3mg001_030 [Candidatus Pacearchaeota archaeon]|nr:MAG: hypothetical protein KatS3mg001_030 [Candidatus Pacearchaeota archaeon]
MFKVKLTQLMRMVKQTTKNKIKLFQCEECGFYYKTKNLAEKCENFCRKNKSCSVEITKHAIRV